MRVAKLNLRHQLKIEDMEDATVGYYYENKHSVMGRARHLNNFLEAGAPI